MKVHTYTSLTNGVQGPNFNLRTEFFSLEVPLLKMISKKTILVRYFVISLGSIESKDFNSNKLFNVADLALK